jgi:hypothetical protein
VFGLLAALTIVVGVLLGFDGYFHHFQRHNPALMQSLNSHLDICH